MDEFCVRRLQRQYYSIRGLNIIGDGATMDNVFVERLPRRQFGYRRRRFGGWREKREGNGGDATVGVHDHSLRFEELGAFYLVQEQTS